MLYNIYIQLERIKEELKVSYLHLYLIHIIIYIIIVSYAYQLNVIRNYSLLG
jgi:hypothetical protein